jgi:phage baseplate assembly protein W
MNEKGFSDSFLGTGWNFPPEFNKRSKEVKMVSEEEDIRQSLRILLSTAPGERIMNPAYGCGLKSITFGNITSSTITEVKDMIERAILFFEPRITLDNVEIDTGEMYEGVLRIQIGYTVRTTNNRSNMVYPFYFLEATNIRL